MKKIIIALLLGVLSITALQARTFVLVTGVSNYGQEDANLGQSTKDAKRFKEVMEAQTKDITLLTSSNVTKANVLEKLKAICNRAQKGDRIIFFYAGHGMPGAICAYDQPIAYDDLISTLSESQASEKICFIDACHAGTMAKNYNDDNWSNSVKSYPGQIFFVACRPDEYSSEHEILGAGFFTQALLKGLRGKADKNNNRQVTVLELFKYVYGDVLKRSKGEQHPQLIAPKSTYDIVLTKW